MTTEEAFAAEIHDLTHDGRGVADLDGQRVFVAGALPQERVLIRPRRRRRRFQEAELVGIVETAKTRVEPGCEYFGRCGGCAVQHMDYEEQLRFKQSVVAEAFARIAEATPEHWLDPVSGPLWNYRRKARLSAKFVAGKQRVLVGFRERDAPYVTDMNHCAVLVPPMDTALGELAGVIQESSLRSRIPQIEIAMGDRCGAIVLRVLEPPTAEDEMAFRAFGERHDLDVYVQPGGPGTTRPLTPEARILSYVLSDYGIELEFVPTDFIQINADVNARMVAAAVETAQLKSSDRVLDLYCGLGNFSLPLARQADTVLGVEGEAGLVARAARNAELNEIPNIRFITADLAQ